MTRGHHLDHLHHSLHPLERPSRQRPDPQKQSWPLSALEIGEDRGFLPLAMTVADKATTLQQVGGCFRSYHWHCFV